MVFTGYLSMGGREVINGGRTSAYVQMLLPTLGVMPCADCEGLYEVLGHKGYSSPLVDQPEWFDPDNSDTWDFYGLYPLSFEGFEDATTTAAVTEFVYDGGAISPVRRGSRSVRVTGLLIGASDAAVSVGMTWLRQVLRPGVCSTRRTCTGEHLSYFTSCPPLCEESPDLAVQLEQQAVTGTPLRECATGVVVAPLTQCVLPYERHLYNTVCVDGPRIVEQFNPSCGAMVRVEFTIVAGVPSPFGTARQIADVNVIPANLPVIGDYSCDPTSDGTLVQRTNLAPNPGPTLNEGWASLDTSYWTNTWDTTVVHTAGGKSAKSTRSVVGGWAPAVIGGTAFTGAYGPSAAMMPIVSPGLTFTASVWMRPSVQAVGYLEVQPVNALGNPVGQPWKGMSDVSPANTWVRVAVTRIAPMGAVAVRLTARMQVPSGAAAAASYAHFTEALFEASTGASGYFDGNSVSTVPPITYTWFGVPGHSSSRQVQAIVPGPIIDPDCPPIPAPPRPPIIDESCLSDVTQYRRFTVPIPADVVPRWSDLVPIVNLTTGGTPVRQLRVRFYSNPAEREVFDLVPCAYVGEFIVSYLPAKSTMTIDGTSQEVIVVGPTGLPQTGSHLLYGSGGGPMVWPFMSCGNRYDLAVDVDPAATGLEFQLCVAARE